jgi:hypothetical protein
MFTIICVICGLNGDIQSRKTIEFGILNQWHMKAMCEMQSLKKILDPLTQLIPFIMFGPKCKLHTIE